MQKTKVKGPVAPADKGAGRYEALRTLTLYAEELVALRRQGFISAERRRPGGTVLFKLRLRIDGRQRTRYLGTDLSFIERVRSELATLQAATKRDRKLEQAVRRARVALRAAKAALAPYLIAAGYRYHGLTIRRRRPHNEQAQIVK